MDDLISEFITETAESIETIDSELVRLEQEPGNAAVLGNIFRLMHTIKGTCGFLGLPRLASVAHACENVLSKIRDKEMAATPGIVSLVLASIDRIKTLMAYLEKHGQEEAGDDAELIAKLDRCAGNTSSAPPVVLAEPVTAMPVSETPPKPAAPEAQESHAPSGAAQSIRVSLEVLDGLMQMVGELVLTRNQLLQIVRARGDAAYNAPLQHLSHITTGLQEGVMKTRMQPIGNAWSKFPRLLRDLAQDLGKKIDLRMIGEETELDRQMIEMVRDPLTHMVRNSADHGLETPEERRKAGKAEIGTVTLSAFHEGGYIVIGIEDDGKGLNVARIRAKALEKGLVTEEALTALTDQQAMQFIFRPGFSTADKVTSVSGRGVGMDVVQSNIERIGGTVELSSTLGKGSKFIIKIPLTLAIIQGLLVSSAGERFMLPQINVQEIVAAGENHPIEHMNNASVMRLRGRLLPLISLAQTFGLTLAQGTERFVAVCNAGDYGFGLMVERVFDTEEIVVKPASALLRSITLYSGNTILGDGSVIMILDPTGLARAAGAQEIGGGGSLEAARGESAPTNMTDFLVFLDGDDTPKALPLQRITRLEKIDMQERERASGQDVVQYRGAIMRLLRLHSDGLPERGEKEVIVLTDKENLTGLVVDEVIDIISAPYDIRFGPSRAGFEGSMVLAGLTTDIVDVDALLQRMEMV